MYFLLSIAASLNIKNIAPVWRVKKRTVHNDESWNMISSTLKRFFRKKGTAIAGSYFCKASLFLLLLALAFPPVTFGFPSFKIFTESEENPTARKLSLGRVQLHPAFSFESTYNDNIFLLANKVLASGPPEGKEGDFIFVNKPSLGMELKRIPGEIFGFNLNYQAEDEHFVDLGDTQDVVNHSVSGNLNFGGTGGKSNLTLGGNYQKTRNAQSFDIQTNVGNRAGIQTYVGLLDFIYLPSKVLRFALGSSLIVERFDSPNQVFDSNLYNATGSVHWQSSPLLAYGVSYIYSVRDYDMPVTGLFNSDTHQFSLAANWQATPWLDGELSVGMNSKNYDDFTRLNVVFQFDLKYRPVNRTQITFKANREIRDSLFQGVRFVIYHGIRLEIARSLGKKFLAEITGRYGNYDYRLPTVDSQGGGTLKTRIDNRVEASLALTYQIQDWLAATARYRYVENHSNYDGSEFINNVGTIEISAAY
jgi:hypothetical protein